MDLKTIHKSYDILLLVENCILVCLAFDTREFSDRNVLLLLFDATATATLEDSCTLGLEFDFDAAKAGSVEFLIKSCFPVCRK